MGEDNTGGQLAQVIRGQGARKMGFASRGRAPERTELEGERAGDSTLAGACWGWQQQQIKTASVVNQGEDKVRERR